jgi:hypothetical protein
VGVVDREGGGLIVAGTFVRSLDEGFDGSERAMRINSDTVTNLKPFASS